MADHDGIVRAEEVAKYLLLKFRKTKNMHNKVISRSGVKMQYNLSS